MQYFNLHDILVHKIIINSKKNDFAFLVIDIDWFDADFSENDPKGVFPFLIQPARLVFNDVSNISVNIARATYPGLFILESNFQKIDEFLHEVKIKFSNQNSFLSFNAKDNKLIKYGTRLKKINTQELDDDERNQAR